MELKKFDTIEDLALNTAQEIFLPIKEQIKDEGHYTLGLTAGSSPKKIYAHLVHILDISHLDLSQLHAFNVDEYYPMEQFDDHSYFQETFHAFWQPLHDGNSTFNFAHGHIPDGEAEDPDAESKRYEEKIKEVGGIDQMILGLGENGHIGFNEPGSDPESRTRLVELSEATRKANSKFFDDDMAKVPEKAITMGIGTILEARKIALIVSGEAKKDILAKLLKLEEPTKDIPASYLIGHDNVTIYTDLKV